MSHKKDKKNKGKVKPSVQNPVITPTQPPTSDVTTTTTVQPEVDKVQGGLAVVISSTVLGQKRSEYNRLKEKGLTEESITRRMSEDAQLYGVSLEKYQEMLSNLKSRGVKGENLDKLRAEHIDKLVVGAKNTLGYLNGLLTTDVDSLNFPTLQGFVKSTKQSLIELVNLLQNVDITTKKGKQAWCFLLHSPVFNFLTEQPTDTKLFALLVGGWSDKSRSYDQYGVRQEPSGSATFYRPVSYEQPITEPQIIEE